MLRHRLHHDIRKSSTRMESEKRELVLGAALCLMRSTRYFCCRGGGRNDWLHMQFCNDFLFVFFLRRVLLGVSIFLRLWVFSSIHEGLLVFVSDKSDLVRVSNPSPPPEMVPFVSTNQAKRSTLVTFAVSANSFVTKG